MSQSRAGWACTSRRGGFASIGWCVALGLLAALPGGPARPPDVVAQVSAPAARPAPATSPARAPAPAAESGRSVGDLTTRYRFLERYATTEDPSRPSVIAQVRVGIVETIKTEIENPRGAPDRKQVTAQTIYTERPAEIGPDGAVAATVRRYETFRLNPEPASRPSDPRPLEGLNVWYQSQAGGDPQVLSLSGDRQLREVEFSIITRQPFLPALSAVLPSLPSRIGDRWRVPKGAVQALLGERPKPGEGGLMATFHEVRNDPKGSNLVAIIAVAGAATLEGGPTSYNAELQFTFSPPGAPADEGGAPIVEARGFLSELRAAQVTDTPLPGSKGRLRQTQTRELILARQRDHSPPLAAPNSRPIPSVANSWLVYVDPRKRYHFQHPQSFLADSLTAGDSVELVRPRPEGPDLIVINLQLRTGDPVADRNNLDPEFHRKFLEEIWRQDRKDVLRGATGWLPEADWKSSGMKVYRIEAALRESAGRGAPVQRRAHLDYYLILTSRPESLVVHATTLQDPPTDFRKEAEAVIKSFRFGPPEAKAGSGHQ